MYDLIYLVCPGCVEVLQTCCALTAPFGVSLAVVGCCVSVDGVGIGGDV